MRILIIILVSVASLSLVGQAFAGDCASGNAKFKTATDAQQIHAALAAAFDTKTADDVVTEHGDTLSELKEISKRALEACK